MSKRRQAMTRPETRQVGRGETHKSNQATRKGGAGNNVRQWLLVRALQQLVPDVDDHRAAEPEEAVLRRTRSGSGAPCHSRRAARDPSANHQQGANAACPQPQVIRFLAHQPAPAVRENRVPQAQDIRQGEFLGQQQRDPPEGEELVGDLWWRRGGQEARGRAHGS